jgi:UDP:flavonoid glycosyltransferase YjiC (YdhE family)
MADASDPAGRILFVTWGSLGDLHPYIALGLELQRRGHRVAIATLGAFREFVQDAGLSHFAIKPDVSLDDPGAYLELVRRALDAKEGPQFLFTKVLNPAMRQTYADTVSAIDGMGGVDLLISHQVPVTTPLVAQKLGIRWVSAVLLPMAFLSEFDPSTAPQAPWLQPIAASHRLLARAFNALGRRISDPWVAPVRSFRRELGLPPAGSPVFEGQHSPWLVLGLFSQALARVQPDYPPQAIVTGFAFYDGAGHRPASPELSRFLEDGEPPIVFTLGSSAVWIAKDFYDVSLDAVRRLNVRALFLAGQDTERLRTRLPDSVFAVDYAPHSEVMARASVIVHQGGVGTTGQALRAGRPMLVVPFGQDQPDNARRCVSLGVARTISRNRYKANEVARALADLRRDPVYAANASQIAALVGAERGTQTACDAIEKVLRN